LQKQHARSLQPLHVLAHRFLLSNVCHSLNMGNLRILSVNPRFVQALIAIKNEWFKPNCDYNSFVSDSYYITVLSNVFRLQIAIWDIHYFLSNQDFSRMKIHDNLIANNILQNRHARSLQPLHVLARRCMLSSICYFLNIGNLSKDTCNSNVQLKNFLLFFRGTI
jgi:hypothetical protein